MSHRKTTDKERKSIFAKINNFKYRHMWWRAKCRLNEEITEAPKPPAPKGPALVLPFKPRT